ncbi:hypothetical protein ACLEIY_16740 [Acetobacter tropicalis]|uniref:hypothetical protein n=1 Tax=Acetobacter tropicalis TaxID=104102 RepID=UPI003976C342
MVLVAVLFAVVGCAMGPDFVRPKPILPDHWQNADTVARSQPSSALWWGIFNDPVLNSLMRRAETGNLDMVLARERIRAARIQRRAASAESLPSLNGQAAYTHERLATAGVGQVLQPLLGLSPEMQGQEPEGVSYTNYSIGAVASWELDLWGRQQRRNFLPCKPIWMPCISRHRQKSPEPISSGFGFPIVSSRLKKSWRERKTFCVLIRLCMHMVCWRVLIWAVNRRSIMKLRGKKKNWP